MKFLSLNSSALVVSISALFFLVAVGCASRIPSVSSEVGLEQDEYAGSITNEFETDGCPWLIQYNDGHEDRYLIPVQLDQEFKKNGLKVQFRFHYSRILQADCQMGQPAVLEQIKAK
ncbi:MAG: hypothetical protein H6603_11790 [Flavobacteriales bacterium]|nr:hypothetical protein [Flavobacteriales bacterium]